MSEKNSDINISKETKKNLIYQTGWLTIIPIGIWYIFNFLFNVGALYFYGINSGYSSMKVEIDFFSLIYTACIFLIYFVFIYDLIKEKIRLYKVLTASCFFLISIILLFINILVGILSGIALTIIFLFISKKGFFKDLKIYKKNIIIISSFLSFVLLSFYSGYFYSKTFSDYYCIEESLEDNTPISKVLIARIDNNIGIFVDAYNSKINSFNKDKYEIRIMNNINLEKCGINQEN